MNKKILFINMGLSPEKGGQTVYIKELYKRTPNSIVLTCKEKEQIKGTFQVPGVNNNPLIFAFLSYLYYLLTIKRETNIGIIHGQAIFHLFFILFKEKNIKYVTTTQNSYLQRLESKKNRLRYRLIYPFFIWLEKFVLDKSDAIICVSENTRIFIEKITKNRNIFVIPNGVDMNRFSPGKERRKKSFKFLFVGRLAKRKRVLETINIFSKFQHSVKEKCELDIVGNGNEYEIIKKFLEINKIKNVFLKGFHKNPSSFYRQSDCLLLLSLGEGLPLVIVEALASGIPAIVTEDAAGKSNIIKNGYNGYIVKDNLEDNEVLEKLKLALKNINKLKENARKSILKYSWDNIVKENIKIYESL